MTTEELRDMMQYVMNRVTLDAGDTESPVILFNAPIIEEMVAAGLNEEGSKRLLNVPWWEEMVTDIIETPDICDPDDSPEIILQFARDVVSEYIRKRFPLNPE